jgi:uncharacterized iron-regulated membrane protein
MARGMSLSVRRGLLLVSALIFAVARAQAPVPGCTGCTVTCGGMMNANAPLTLRVTCATPSGGCAACIGSSSQFAFDRATSSLVDSPGGCPSQVSLAALILGECTAGSISLPTATTGGTGNAVIIGPTLTSPTGSIF